METSLVHVPAFAQTPRVIRHGEWTATGDPQWIARACGHHIWKQTAARHPAADRTHEGTIYWAIPVHAKPDGSGRTIVASDSLGEVWAAISAAPAPDRDAKGRHDNVGIVRQITNPHGGHEPIEYGPLRVHIDAGDGADAMTQHVYGDPPDPLAYLKTADLETARNAYWMADSRRMEIAALKRLDELGDAGATRELGLEAAVNPFHAEPRRFPWSFIIVAVIILAAAVAIGAWVAA